VPHVVLFAAAERIGVFAEPELEFRHLGSNHAFLVIASDGVFEFISSQRVVDMVSALYDTLFAVSLCCRWGSRHSRIWSLQPWVCVA
jgi:serine/threonine protein phosphatase PrpC